MEHDAEAYENKTIGKFPILSLLALIQGKSIYGSTYMGINWKFLHEP